MIKDKFEIQIGEQLRNATLPVPAGSWEAIHTRIGKSGGASSSSISSAGAIVGLIAASTLLVFIALTSGGNKELNQSKEHIPEIHVQNTIEQPSETVDPGIKTTTEANPISSTDTKQITPKSPVKIISGASHLDTEAEETVETNNPELNRVHKNSATEIETPNASIKEVKSASKPNGSMNENQAPVETFGNTTPAPVKAQIDASLTSGYAPLTVKFKNNGNGSEAFWEFGTVAESHDLKPEVVFEEPGVYTVNLTVTNSNGGISEDYLQITVKEGSSFYLPNSFTPNGDGINDAYKVGSARNIKSFYMVVTDEHGNTIFQTRSVNEAWDYNQTTNGNPETRYFVTYRAVGIDGKIYSAKLQSINIFF